MATKATNSQFDTKKVNRSIVLLGWQAQRVKATIDPTTGKRTSTGNDIIITGTTKLYYPQKLVAWFNIPTYTPPTTGGGGNDKDLKVVKVKAHTRSFYSSIDDTTATPISIPTFYRIIGGGGGVKNRGKSVLVNLGEGKLTARNTPRTISLKFPKFFNNIMIAQALGQMLFNASATKKPAFFTTRNGTTYMIPYNSSKTPLNSTGVGAWLVTVESPGTNQDNPDDIGASNSVISSAGDQDGAV